MSGTATVEIDGQKIRVHVLAVHYEDYRGRNLCKTGYKTNCGASLNSKDWSHVTYQKCLAKHQKILARKKGA